MSGPLNSANYPTLYLYAIIAQAGITSALDTTVNSGY